ncbi:hypothetical protein C8Q70DRAFT_583402 [Cubamyces menziesii]|nr:hypothetical protein C8Q70DRAFT_583402 [Cubamyces menziesii]
MAGRRLTISALLCTDDQPPDRPHATAHSPPSTSTSATAPGLDVVTVEQAGSQARLDGLVESRQGAVYSTQFPDFSRDSRSLVPLPIQPVHVRRHTPSPPAEHRANAHFSLPERGRRDSTSDRPETIPTSTTSRSPVSAATSRPVPIPRRSSDPRGANYHLYENSSYFARPLSSNSAFSDSPVAAYTTPHALSPHRHSHPLGQPLPSPQSSIHTHLMSPPASYGDSSQPTMHLQNSPIRSQSPTLSPHVGSPEAPRGEPSVSRRSHFRSASHTQSGSPSSLASRTSSVTALPNLLNGESPRSPAAPFMPHGSPGGLGALEALVQAATEERRRLSARFSIVCRLPYPCFHHPRSLQCCNAVHHYLLHV